MKRRRSWEPCDDKAIAPVMADRVSREEVLADFQACTGIDDLGEAILHLEETNWNLVAAVNRVLPQESQTLPLDHAVPDMAGAAPASGGVNMANVAMSNVGMSNVGIGRARPLHMPIFPHSLPPRRTAAGVGGTTSGGGIGGAGISTPPAMGMFQRVSMSNDIIPLPSTSQGASNRLLNFDVKCGNNTAHIQISDAETVGMLKTRLLGEFGIPLCQQELQGWKHMKVPDSALLATLGLPKDNRLTLAAPNNVLNMDGDRANDKETFTLNITDRIKHKNYSLKFPGNKTILDVKSGMYTLTDVPARDQVWSGWPCHAVDTNTLSESGINYPTHDLVVKRKIPTKHPTSVAKESSNKKIVVDSDSSSDDFEDASETFTVDDDIFGSDIPTRKIQPLIPDNAEDETAASLHFVEEFGNRYGELRPMFFQGSLEEAMREACFRPAKERRLLAVYLHHDASVLANVFCTQLLCAESLVTFLATNFILWGWDLTFDSNRARLLSMVVHHFGPVVADTIRSIEVERLPVLLIIMRTRSSTEVVNVISGNILLDELMTNLIHSVDVFTEQQRLEVREEEERAARERVKQEQDEAYQLSLQADRAKEEARKHEREERERKDREREQEQERVQAQQQKQQAKKEAHRLLVESQLPPEPEDVGDFLYHVRCRLPSGEVVSRRFNPTDSLKVLFDFLLVKGYPTSEYKVLTSWPKKDLTSFALSTQVGAELHQQETLTLEEK